jgi:rubrerythrin
MRPQVIVTLTLPLTLEPEPPAKLAPRAKKPAAPPTVPPVEPPAAKVKPAKAPKPPVPASKTPVPAPAKPAKAEEKTVSAKRGRRSKIPDNLAEQYGQNLSRRAATAPVEVESESPRKRMTREEREKRRQLMAPDPGLLQRLARAHAAASTAPKRASKPRGWELRCGRCGTVTRFTTPGAVCPKCGAIGLKDSLG